MASIKFKRFTKFHVLKSIGRALLGQFFDRFQGNMAEKGVVLPDSTVADEDYFTGVAGLLASPEGLPSNLNEALYAIDEMATEDGQQRLEEGITQAQLGLSFDEKSTREDIALQVWLADPALLTQKHNEQRLVRLSSFEYYSTATPTDHSATFQKPDTPTIQALTASLDTWFGQHNRGHQTTQIETHVMDGEFWFVIRHGDTYARTPRVDGQTREVIHYRPEKDDVVVYAPDLDEIRIHAATKGEKQLYREKFGLYLFGREDYFSEYKTYTLDPLRQGIDSLAIDGIDGLRQIVLREVEMGWNGGFNDALVRKSDNVFLSASSYERPFNPINDTAQLRRASFDVYFTDSDKPRKLQVRPPNILKLGRHCDARLVHRWLSRQNFRISTRVPE